MTITKWKAAVDGEATDASNWTNGIGPGLTAAIALRGAYAVVDDGDFVARSLIIKAQGHTFSESTTGTMHLQALILYDQSSVDLAGDNFIRTIEMHDSKLDVFSSAAIGRADFNCYSSVIVAHHNFTIKGDLNIIEGNCYFDANGNKIAIKGDLVAPDVPFLLINSSAPGGVVQLDSANYSGPSTGFEVIIFGGTLKAGEGVLSSGLHGWLSHALHVGTYAGGTIDLNGMDSLTINNLYGEGRLTNSGTSTTVLASAFNFHGILAGSESFIFSGDNDLSNVTLNLAHDETLQFASDTDTTLNLELAHAKPGATIDLDMSSNGTTQVRISDGFVGHGSGFGTGDEFRVRHFSYTSASLDYVADSDPAAGGELHVSDGAGHAVDMHIVGQTIGGENYSEANFTLSSDGHNGILIDFLV